MQFYFGIQFGEFAFKADDMGIDLIWRTIFMKAFTNNEVTNGLSREIILQPIKQLPGGYGGNSRGNNTQRVTCSDSTFFGTVIYRNNTCDSLESVYKS